MQIHLIKKQTIENYVRRNSQSRTSFQNWMSILKEADWNNPNDIIFTFRSADLLGNKSERIVFNIGGNKYRMICQYQFGKKKVHLFVNWIGTHADYQRLCSFGKQYSVNEY